MDRIIGAISRLIEWCLAVCPRCGCYCEKRAGHGGRHKCYDGHVW